MLDNNKIIEFCNKINITKQLLLENYFTNNKEILSIFKKLYYLVMGIKIYKMNLQYVLLFTPLPRYFKITDHSSKFINMYNKYSNCDDTANSILMGNVILPHPSTCPIPFLFQHKYNNRFRYTISNVYYYELTVDKNSFKEPFANQAISIGYGAIRTPINYNFVGWAKHTVGYHSDDGMIYADNVIIAKSDNYSNGDIVGAGLIYLEKNKYKIFFTLNGNLINLYQTLITTKKLTVMMNIHHSSAVKINFGETNFLFDFTTLITSNIITTKNNFIDNFSLDKFIYNSNKNTYKFNNILLQPLLEIIS
jgi:hypothetical protein